MSPMIAAKFARLLSRPRGIRLAQNDGERQTRGTPQRQLIERLAVEQLLGALFALFLFFFLALVFGHFFFGHLVILAGGEHFLAGVRVATGTQAPALLSFKAGNAAQRFRDRAAFDKQLAYFLEKIVEVVGREGIGKPLALE